MSEPFVVRPATPADAPIIARHRAEMFLEMGQLAPELYDDLVEQTTRYLLEAMPTGEYVGWFAAPPTDLHAVIGGAGVQRRRTLPHPFDSPARPRVAVGRQAIILNVFTEKGWRRRGVAALMMDHVVRWARSANLDTLVLHASAEGKRLYERLGFIPTTEMRYPTL